ncbi:MAG: HD domain-containing phosphohydrolase, partial [Acidobacteriota bacterium]
MRLISILVGLAGLALATTTVMAESWDPSSGFFAIVVICALGGLLPLRLPGLSPLPASLPLIGAVAMTAGAPAATIAGFVSGLATLAQPREKDWVRGFATGGATALAAAIIAGGARQFGLSLSSREVFLPPAPRLGWWLLLMTAAFFLARVTVLYSSSVAPRPHAVRRAALGWAAASVCAATALGLAGAMLLWGRAPVLACAASAGLVALVDAWRGTRLGQQVRMARRRARTSFAVMESIALAIEAKDRTSERHLRRMRIYSVGIGRLLGMTREELESLEYAALLHDIGKLVVPESVLSKPAGLSSEEFQIVANHPKVGAEILEATSLPRSVVQMVRHHHERYDGSGYPDGLMGMEIPLGARILAAADTFEALTSDRPHRPGVPVDEAIAHLRLHAGTLFDPRVARILVEHHEEFERRVRASERLQGAGSSPATTGAHGTESAPTSVPFQPVLDRIASAHMEIYSLYEISQALGKTLDLEESFALISAKVGRLLHFSSCAVYVLEKGVLRARFTRRRSASRLASHEIALGQRVSGWAAMHERPCTARVDARDQAPPRWEGTRSDLEALADDEQIGRLASSLAVPLMVDGTLVGVMTLYDDADHPYSPQEEHLLALMSNQIAAAIRAGLRLEKAQEGALMDTLTGLPNARCLSLAFEREATGAREASTPLTLLAVRIDDFNQVVTDAGQQASDRFMTAMARTIRSHLRVRDTCGRYSADTFVALLPGTPAEEAAELARTLRLAAAEFSVEARPGRTLRSSLSMGWATLKTDGENFEELLAAASARIRQDGARVATGLVAAAFS